MAEEKKEKKEKKEEKLNRELKGPPITPSGGGNGEPGGGVEE